MKLDGEKIYLTILEGNDETRMFRTRCCLRFLFRHVYCGKKEFLTAFHLPACDPAGISESTTGCRKTARSSRKNVKSHTILFAFPLYRAVTCAVISQTIGNACSTYDLRKIWCLDIRVYIRNNRCIGRNLKGRKLKMEHFFNSKIVYESEFSGYEIYRYKQSMLAQLMSYQRRLATIQY